MKGALIALAVLALWGGSAQARCFIRPETTAGPLAIQGNCAWLSGETDVIFTCQPVGVFGAFECDLAKSPITGIKDSQGDAITEDTIKEIWPDATLDTYVGAFPWVAQFGVESSYRPTYSAAGLAGMGGVTTTIPSNYVTELALVGAGRITRSGNAMGNSHEHQYYIANYNTSTHGGAKKYMRAWGGGSLDLAPTTSGAGQARAAVLPCAVRAISITYTDGTPTIDTIDAACTFTMGFRVDGGDSPTACTMTSAAAGEKLCHPPETAVSWDIGAKVAMWFDFTGTCTETPRYVTVRVGCW